MVDVIPSDNGEGGARGCVAGVNQTIDTPKRCINNIFSKCKACPNFIENLHSLLLLQEVCTT